MRLKTLLLSIVVGLVIGLAIVYAFRPPGLALPRPPDAVQRLFSPSEKQLRAAFYKDHAGGKPLNWAIAEMADEMHESKPMGKFVLHENDCSDFMEAVVDEGLGATARFKRESDRHILTRRSGLWNVFYWDRKAPLLPGDQVSVRHSPHYAPKDGSIGHCGLIGSDGNVRDWSKLRSWSTDRYGSNSVEWFTRHSPGPREVVITRLRPEYRYLAKPVPLPTG